VRTITEIEGVRDWRRSLTGSLGLVPTMGSLHRGHSALVGRARRENEHVGVSLFVNPAQFGPTEDLARYPRDLPRDERILRDAGCDVLFAPATQEMYPAGFETMVDVGSVASPLEGERRPGHFRGVATVVLKLFGVFQPDRAYFGQKDAQQLSVIRRMVRDLNLPVMVEACATVREEDGLALSSRNAYLSPEQRRAAPVLHRALCAGRDLWVRGERQGEALRRVMREALAAEPLARPGYVSVADPATLAELDRAEGPALLSLAVFVGSTRLIDCLQLG